MGLLEARFRERSRRRPRRVRAYLKKPISAILAKSRRKRIRRPPSAGGAAAPYRSGARSATGADQKLDFSNGRADVMAFSVDRVEDFRNVIQTISTYHHHGSFSAV